VGGIQGGAQGGKTLQLEGDEEGFTAWDQFRLPKHRLWLKYNALRLWSIHHPTNSLYNTPSWHSNKLIPTRCNN
jgi:hypothetical protein